MVSATAGSRGTEAADVNDYAAFGIAIYLALAVGNVLYKLLEYMFVDSDSQLFFQRDNDVVFAALESSFHLVEAGSGFLIALAVGWYCYRTAPADGAAFKNAGIAAASGAGVVLTVLFAGIVLLAPGSANIEFGNEIVGLVLAVAGTGAVAAISALFFENLQDLA